jgi:hypothetical protein
VRYETARPVKTAIVVSERGSTVNVNRTLNYRQGALDPFLPMTTGSNGESMQGASIHHFSDAIGVCLYMYEYHPWIIGAPLVYSEECKPTDDKHTQ